MRTTISHLRIRLSNFFRKLFKVHGPSSIGDQYRYDCTGEIHESYDIEPEIINGLHTCELCGDLYETVLYSPDKSFLPIYYGDNVRLKLVGNTVDEHKTYKIISLDLCPRCAGLVNNYITGLKKSFTGLEESADEQPNDQPTDVEEPIHIEFHGLDPTLYTSSGKKYSEETLQKAVRAFLGDDEPSEEPTNEPCTDVKFECKHPCMDMEKPCEKPCTDALHF